MQAFGSEKTFDVVFVVPVKPPVRTIDQNNIALSIRYTIHDEHSHRMLINSLLLLPLAGHEALASLITEPSFGLGRRSLF